MSLPHCIISPTQISKSFTSLNRNRSIWIKKLSILSFVSLWQARDQIFCFKPSLTRQTYGQMICKCFYLSLKKINVNRHHLIDRQRNIMWKRIILFVFRFKSFLGKLDLKRNKLFVLLFPLATGKEFASGHHQTEARLQINRESRN